WLLRYIRGAACLTVVWSLGVGGARGRTRCPYASLFRSRSCVVVRSYSDPWFCRYFPGCYRGACPAWKVKCALGPFRGKGRAGGCADVFTRLRGYAGVRWLEGTQIFGFVGTCQGVIEVLAPRGKAQMRDARL